MTHITKPDHTAFACAWGDNFFPGLTKREYFAAVALQGLLANPKQHDYTTSVESAVEYADKLIDELNKPKP